MSGWVSPAGIHCPTTTPTLPHRFAGNPLRLSTEQRRDEGCGNLAAPLVPIGYAFRATVLILFQRLVQNRLVEVDIAAAGVGDEFGRRLVLRLGILDVRLGRHPILFALGRLTEQ